MDEPLPIDWTDVCGDADGEPHIPARHRDLWGYGLTADQMHTMTTIKPIQEYL